MTKNKLRLLFSLAGLDDPTTEHKFSAKRKWRFDYAWPELKIAVEWEGIMGGKSRHTTITGYTKDCIKYNRAALEGWRVFRFTAKFTPDEIVDVLTAARLA